MASTKGAAFKYGCLIFLTFQNSALILTMRYSRLSVGPSYRTSTAVLLAELFKCVLSTGGYLCVRNEQTTLEITEKSRRPTKVIPVQLAVEQHGLRDPCHFAAWRWKALIPVLTPSLLYTVQNNLQFTAASNLEAATLQVLYQSKILTTAICAIIFLEARLSIMQIWSIVLLSIGVACAAASSTLEARPLSTSRLVSAHQDRSLGVAAIGFACLTSGFAGVYTESILKRTQQRGRDNSGTEQNERLFWIRNLQLNTTSLAFAAVGVFVLDWRFISVHGFFYGYNHVVWAVIILQAVGGLTVALVITYADNILKGFATSFSIILSTMASAFLWHFQLTPLFIIGMATVLVATQMYSFCGGPRTSSASQSEQYRMTEKKETLHNYRDKIQPNDARDDLETQMLFSN